MAETIQKMPARKLSGKRKSGPSRKRKSRAGGKAAKKEDTMAAPQSPRKVGGVEEECADGAELLQSAANQAVVDSSVKIATGLAQRAEEGDTASAKLLVELMVGKNLPKKAKKRIGPSWVERLVNSPPWVPPLAGEGGEKEKDREQGIGNRELGVGKWGVGSGGIPIWNDTPSGRPGGH